MAENGQLGVLVYIGREYEVVGGEGSAVV